MNKYPKVPLLPAGVLVTLALFGCTLFLPLGAAAIFAVAVPAAYVHMRLGFLGGGGVILFTAGILALGTGQGNAVAYVAQFGLLSFLLPLFLKRGMAWDRAVGLTLVLLLAAGGLLLAGLDLMGGVDVAGMVENQVHQGLQQALTMGGKISFTAEQAALFKQTLEFFKQTWPAVVVTGVGGLQLATVFGLNLLARGEYEIAGTPIHFWKLPEMLIWGLIASGAGVFFGNGIVELVALNLLLIMLACYFLQGLAIVCHYFRKNSVPPVLRTLGYVLVVTLNPLPVIVTGLGVFDLWVDFRKPRKIKD